jgi:hypothetical protein
MKIDRHWESGRAVREMIKIRAGQEFLRSTSEDGAQVSVSLRVVPIYHTGYTY